MMEFSSVVIVPNSLEVEEGGQWGVVEEMKGYLLQGEHPLDPLWPGLWNHFSVPEISGSFDLGGLREIYNRMVQPI